MFGRLGAGPAAVIFDAFRDPEPILYTQGGRVLPPIYAVRAEERAPDFSGPGQTLLRVTFEVQQRAPLERPANTETFTHRGRRWRVMQVEDLDALGAWLLTVSDAGAAL